MIFLSWSKSLSNKLAVSFRNFISGMTKDDDIAWISNDIKQGSSFFTDIESAMKDAGMSVIFLTRDNIANPWINYELGFFASGGKPVFPVFFDSADIYADLKMTPFEHLQVKDFSKENMRDIVSAIADQHDLDKSAVLEEFEKMFPAYNEETQSILSDSKYYDVDSISDIKFMLTKNLRLINEDERVLYFEHGFETHDFYSFVLRTVKKRLLVYGRKNKKIFDRSNITYFKSISEKIKNSDFEMRILSFSPQADESLLNAAQKKRNFKTALENSVNDALDILDECGINYHDVLRFYNFYRNELIVVMDNCVFFVNISYDIDGKPFHLTDSPFYACDAGSTMGRKIIDTFNNAYEKSVDLDL
ncbi:MAG: toll/interleukin-1 receptor domain-containing protein [Lachnospiraceae bacterium]|nr:toll/interleukin-1 receptor domain-containing protein [Lachnospiraceae bacterium]